MVYWMESGEQITEIGLSRRNFYEECIGKLSNQEMDNIKDYINSDIDEFINSDNQVYVPGHRVPTDWSGTELQVIYDKACGQNPNQSALVYGLITLEVMIDRFEKWMATKSNYNRDFDQMTYWLQE